MSKQPESELLAVLSACPLAGTRFQHYKGAVYEVVGRCIREATREPCVLYRPQGSEVVWCRTLSDWQQEVETDSVKRPRFQQIE